MSEQSKQNEKLARWAGLTKKLDGYWYEQPDTPFYFHTRVPDFRNDLSAIFQRLIPKCGAYELGDIDHDRHYAKVWRESKRGLLPHGWSFDNSPSIALCNAIENMIDSQIAEVEMPETIEQPEPTEQEVMGYTHEQEFGQEARWTG